LLSFLFFVATNFRKFTKNYFCPKNVTKLAEIWVEDPGSGKTYPGSMGKKAPDQDPDPEHCNHTTYFLMSVDSPPFCSTSLNGIMYLRARSSLSLSSLRVWGMMGLAEQIFFVLPVPAPL
jgi:hypothetical protein